MKILLRQAMKSKEILEGGGNCYQANCEKFLELHMEQLTLVHGLVVGKGVTHPHCWVEDTKNETVLDFSNGNSYELPKEVYYNLGQVSRTKHYSIKEVYKQLVIHNHYGAWDEFYLNYEVKNY